MGSVSFTFEWPSGERERTRQLVIMHDVAINDMSRLWVSFIPTILNRHSTTFRRQASPFDGRPWAPLSDEYAERKAKLVRGIKAARRKAAAAKRGKKAVDVRKVIRNVRKAFKLATELSQGKISKGLVRSVIKVARQKARRGLGKIGDILVLSGTLKRAASVKGAAGQMISVTPQALVFSVMPGSLYPMYHQTTARIRKDGQPIKRQWFGLVREDFYELYIQAKRHIGDTVRRAPGLYRQ